MSWTEKEVILLPANKKEEESIKIGVGEIILIKETDELSISHQNHHYKEVFDYWVPKCMYLTSSEGIEKGDHYYSKALGSVFQAFCESLVEGANASANCKKIVSCDDKTLGLPAPNLDFIEQYMSEHNKGNIITKVLVEHDCDHILMPEKVVDVLKVNPKNNTINIKMIKGSWNREELDEILLDVMSLGMDLRQSQLQGHSTKSGKEILNDWKKENL